MSEEGLVRCGRWRPVTVWTTPAVARGVEAGVVHSGHRAWTAPAVLAVLEAGAVHTAHSAVGDPVSFFGIVRIRGRWGACADPSSG